MVNLIDCYGFDDRRNKILFEMYGVDPVAGKIYNKKTGKEIRGGADKKGYRLIHLQYYGIKIRNMRSSLVFESVNKNSRYGLPKLIGEKLVKIFREAYEVDHINAKHDDDRIENLQLLVRSANRTKSNKVGVAA
tara:strand:- start:47 stop:448 length:402 start_codon:yes stop_codon:yes gene_type:complete